jgi:N-hydroxyarylamine O-acetyltransferase
MANHYVSTYPESIFLNHLIVARVLPGQRQTLFDSTLSQRGATESKRDLASAEELRAALHDTFGLTLPGQDSGTHRETSAGGLDAVLERIVRSSTSIASTTS